MSIYLDDDHWFIKELSDYFNQNPITKEALLEQSEQVKETFLARYVPIENSDIENERRKKISETMKNRKSHPNSLKNLEKKDYWKGKKQPDDMIEKRRSGLKGHTVSAETRKKISDKAKNYKHMLGKKHSEETKKKMRESAKNRVRIK